MFTVDGSQQQALAESQEIHFLPLRGLVFSLHNPLHHEDPTHASRSWLSENSHEPLVDFAESPLEIRLRGTCRGPITFAVKAPGRLRAQSPFS
jgi:hypothetical protein